jgi:hypothetical protein
MVGRKVGWRVGGKSWEREEEGLDRVEEGRKSRKKCNYPITCNSRLFPFISLDHPHTF